MALIDDAPPEDPTSGVDSGSNDGEYNSDDNGSSSTSEVCVGAERAHHHLRHAATPHPSFTCTGPPYPIHPSAFVTYQPGSIPLVLSAPHGGTQEPVWVPDLTDRRRVADARTLELAQMLAAEIAHLTGGHRPFVVGNRLHRRKMDANREINTATEGGCFATAVYEEYHAVLERACGEAAAAARARPASTSSRRVIVDGEGSTSVAAGTRCTALLIDVHGYRPPKSWRAANAAWDKSWIMVGHLISAKALAGDDSTLCDDADWVRGTNSIGTLLERYGLLAEPSARRPVPTKGKYFSGGHITKKFRRKFGGDGTAMRTLQLEFPRSMRENLDEVVPKVAMAVVKLMHAWDM